MISGRYIFKKTKDIVAFVGVSLPIEEIDPFAECKRVAEVDGSLRLEWSRVLAGDDTGRIQVAETIEIFTKDSSGYVDELSLVFNGLLTQQNYVEVFRLIPGEWITSIDDMSKKIKIKHTQ